MVTTERDVFHSRAFAVGVAQSVVWIGLGVAALNVVPNFEKIFRDFNTKLPDMTIAVLNFSHFLGHYWYLAPLPVLAWPFVNWGIVCPLVATAHVAVQDGRGIFATWGSFSGYHRRRGRSASFPSLLPASGPWPFERQVIGVKTAEGNAVDDRRGLRAFANLQWSPLLAPVRAMVPCCVVRCRSRSPSRSCRALRLGLSHGDNDQSVSERWSGSDERPLHLGGRSHATSSGSSTREKLRMKSAALLAWLLAWKINFVSFSMALSQLCKY